MGERNSNMRRKRDLSVTFVTSRSCPLPSQAPLLCLSLSPFVLWVVGEEKTQWKYKWQYKGAARMRANELTQLLVEMTVI